MSPTDAFDDRRRAQEEDYFRRKDQELIEKLRRRSEADEALRQMAEQTGVADDELLRELQERGFSPQLVRALPLVPFIQVAWADGTVSDAERDLILQQAQTRGLTPDSEGYARIREWLTRRPSDSLFEHATRVIRAMLSALPPDRRAASLKDLVSYSTTIASASGGILGFGSISTDEAGTLKKLAAELERKYEGAVSRLLEADEESGIGWVP
jgi:hypothetical protein